MSKKVVRAGIWRQRCNKRVMITRCKPVEGQRWTDGEACYCDDGRYYDDETEFESPEDLVEYLGPLPPASAAEQPEALNVRVMVMQFEPELGNSRWVDFVSRHRSERALIEALRAGVRRGEWIGWRLITVIREVLGHDKDEP